MAVWFCGMPHRLFTVPPSVPAAEDLVEGGQFNGGDTVIRSGEAAVNNNDTVVISKEEYEK